MTLETDFPIMPAFPDYQVMPVKSLIPYARNSRTHSESQVKSIAASIKEFGFLNPIIVDGNGGIYQAGNWIYSGRSQAQRELLIGGVFTHKRTASAKYGTASPERITKMTGQHVEYAPIEWKHIYLMPLDAEVKAQVLKLAKPYPKRAKEQDSGDHPELAGVTPSCTLQPMS